MTCKQAHNRVGTCWTSKLIAAIRTVSVAVTHPSVDDTCTRATVEAVGGTSRGTRGYSVRSNTTYKGGDSSLMLQRMENLVIQTQIFT